MYDQCVVAVYGTADGARLAVQILNRADFPIDQVSMVTQHSKDLPQLAAEVKYGDDSIRDAFIGAGLGGLVGVLAGTSLVAIAGGAVLIAGPLAGLATGTIVGALLGSIEGWGVHRSNISHYEKLIGEGKALVIAYGNPMQLDEAQRVLAQTAAQELRLHAKSSDDAAEIDD